MREYRAAHPEENRAYDRRYYAEVGRAKRLAHQGTPGFLARRRDLQRTRYATDSAYRDDCCARTLVAP
jgi:hypothetical protein